MTRLSRRGGGVPTAPSSAPHGRRPPDPRLSSSARYRRASGTRTAMSARRLKSTGNVAIGSTAASVSCACSRAEELPSSRAEPDPLVLSESGIRRLAPRAAAAARRTATGTARSAARRSSGTGIGTGSSGASRGSTDELPLDTRNRNLPAREAKRPLVLDHPDGVVPALAERPRRARVEHRELLGE